MSLAIGLPNNGRSAFVKTRTGPDRTRPDQKSDGSEQERQSSPAPMHAHRVRSEVGVI